jgi:hypothetical protein
MAMAVPALIADDLPSDFRTPPDSARPGVYWYFMDGNMNREEMTKDLESMKDVGIGNLIFLEVDVGIPRGPVDFMGEEWQELFVHAVRKAEELGIEITLGVGPGWSGSGGPWVPVEESMQHLVHSMQDVKGPGKFNEILALPKQKTNRFHDMDDPFYKDVFLWAFPKSSTVISDTEHKALYDRGPYTMQFTQGKNQPFIALPAPDGKYDTELGIDPTKMIDLRSHLERDGRLKWDIPEGDWTILRMGRRSNGAGSRPAPAPGVGFEHDKLDKKALEDHFNHFIGRLANRVAPRAKQHGWTTIHLDSWEMGAQNWSPNLIREFKQRRGYDPTPYFVTFSGQALISVEVSERFLWDFRQTANELLIENYVGHLNTLGDKYGFDFSNEPYAMTPSSNLDQGAAADIPMGEFWSADYGLNSSYSCILASSIAHTMGRSIVAAEAFTGRDKWQQYPGAMKNQGDWAFCIGINRFVFHTFAHKPLGENARPGMTMGPYGVHWDRGQTWWPMVKDYHEYVARCSHMLRQGVTVSDILYLTTEGAPNVFHPPASALDGGYGKMGDKRGYGFDGCSPKMLIERASVRDGKIVFPGGSSYSLLVLPRSERMTPRLLSRLIEMVEEGASIYGMPPAASPSLEGYPGCDAEVRKLAAQLWGESPVASRQVGKGTVFLDASNSKQTELYPDYASTAGLLSEMRIPPDFQPDGPIRFTHRRDEDAEIYFIANKRNTEVAAECTFRAIGPPELWDPVTGERRALPDSKAVEGLTMVPMVLAPHQSFLVIFPEKPSAPRFAAMNFPDITPAFTLKGPWEVSFNPERGGPEKAMFDNLYDWTKSDERKIKYYSGIAVYRQTFDAPGVSGNRTYLDLGTVHDMARVTLNGKDLGVLWCAPWRVDVTDHLKPNGNKLEIEIANRWPNRLLGDQQEPDKDVRTLKWDSGLLGGKKYTTGRYTFTTTPTKELKLLPSGLIGPVRMRVSGNEIR